MLGRFTNRHVIEQCKPDRIVVKTSDGRVSPASILAKSEEYDLAAISTNIKQDAFALVRVVDSGFASLPDIPEDVFTAGYSQPVKNSFKVQLKWGQIQGCRDPAGKSVKTSFENIARMDVDHGGSGSAVLDYNAVLVGIVSARSVVPARDDDHLRRAGYGDRWVHLYNNDAIIAFANKHALNIYGTSTGTHRDPMFIIRHLGSGPVK